LDYEARERYRPDWPMVAGRFIGWQPILAWNARCRGNFWFHHSYCSIYSCRYPYRSNCGLVGWFKLDAALRPIFHKLFPVAAAYFSLVWRLGGSPPSKHLQPSKNALVTRPDVNAAGWIRTTLLQIHDLWLIPSLRIAIPPSLDLMAGGGCLCWLVDGTQFSDQLHF